MQWRSDLIGYDALTSFGSPSYCAQKMFSTYLGDTIVPIASENIPTQTWQPPTPRNRPARPARQLPVLFAVATRSSRIGAIFLKVVNAGPTEQTVHIDISGARAVAPSGLAVVLTSAKPEDTNTIAEPTKVVPVTSKIEGLGTNFTHAFPPYSVNVVQIDAR